MSFLNNPIVVNITSGYAVYKLILFIIGAAVMILLGTFVVKSATRYNHWSKTTGVVTKSVCKGDNSSYLCNAELQYKIKDKQASTVVKSMTMTPYTIGQQIDIRYNPNNTSQVTTQPIGSVKLLGYLVILLGLIFMGLSTYGLNHCIKNNCSTVGAVFGITDSIGLLASLGQSSSYGIGL